MPREAWSVVQGGTALMTYCAGHVLLLRSPIPAISSGTPLRTRPRPSLSAGVQLVTDHDLVQLGSLSAALDRRTSPTKILPTIATPLRLCPSVGSGLAFCFTMHVLSHQWPISVGCSEPRVAQRLTNLCSLRYCVRRCDLSN